MHPNLDQIQNHEAFGLRSLALEAFADFGFAHSVVLFEAEDDQDHAPFHPLPASLWIISELPKWACLCPFQRHQQSWLILFF